MGGNMSDNPQDTGGSGNLRLWKKGQSGNPGGQPKWVSEVRDALKTCVSKGAARLEQIIEQGEDKDAIAATRLAAEFTIRKPKQTHKVTVDRDPLSKVPDGELVEFIKGKKE